MRALIIGATGVAGTAAVRAIRQRHGSDAFVAGVAHDDSAGVQPPGIDVLITGDVTAENTFASIRSLAGEAFDIAFFATARGDVGFPIADASPEQIEEANRVSFLPIPALQSTFIIAKIVGYSTFFTLRHQRINYGAMGHSKAKLEQWVSQRTENERACIRAGAFPSQSSRAIKLLLRRNARLLAASPDPLLRQFFDGAKPSEAVKRLEDAIRDEERQTYGDTDTSAEGLFRAHITLLEHPDAAFVNVCGSRIWLSDDPLRL